MKMSKWLAAASVVAIAAGMPAAANAGGVTETPHAPHNGAGTKMGEFMAYVSAEADAYYDSNVFRRKTGTVNDWVFRQTANIDVKSQWDRNELNFYAGMATLEFSTLNGENVTDLSVGGNGRIDLSQGTSITAGVSYSVAHEDRRSVNQSALLPPNLSGVLNANAAFHYHPSNFGLDVGVALTSTMYDKAKANADRNKDTYTVWGKATYDVSDAYSLFVKAAHDNTDFEFNADRNGHNRDSHTNTVDAGIAIRMAQQLTGEVFFGYMERGFKAPLRDVSGMDVGASLTWKPSSTVAFHVVASHVIDDTTLANTSASDNFDVAGSFDWEALPDLIVYGGIGYTGNNFKGVATRNHDYISGNIGVLYQVTDYLDVGARYNAEQRNSSIATEDYTLSTFMFGANLHI